MYNRRSVARLGLVASLAGMALPLSAQLATIQDPNSFTQNQFSNAREVADITGDSVPDFIIPAPGDQSGRGSAYLYSGANLSLVATLAPTSPAGANSNFGFFLAQAPNLGGSAAPDAFIAATGETFSSLAGAGVLYLYDLAGNAVLGKVGSPNPTASGSFGSVARIQDLNSDSIPDLVVGATGEGPSGGGRFYVLSGADYSPISTVNSPNAVSQGFFGVPFVVPDLNGDAVEDIVIGASGETVGGNTFAGRIYVYSGATRTLLYAAVVSPNSQSNGQFGSTVLALPDSNADGRPELLIGTLEQSFAGRSYVFSGATGTLLTTINPPSPAPSTIFTPSTLLSDLNGDSVPDFAIGSVLSPNAAIYSGADRTLITPFAPSFFAQGSWPSTIADIDGDGRRELLIGDSNFGRVYVYGSAPRLSLSTSSVNFGVRDPAAATPARGTLTLTNTGLTPLTLQAPIATVTGANADQFAINPFPALTTIASNGFTTLGLEFDPTSDGAKQALLSIISNSPSSPTTASLSGIGTSGFGSSAAGVAYVGGGSAIYVVDLLTGNRSQLSGPNTGSGPSLGTINGLEILDDNYLLVASDFGVFRRVDRASGDRLNFPVTLPSFWNAPRGLVRENANSMIVGNSGTGCARINLSTGQITSVSNNHGAGTGTNFFTPFDVAMEANGTIIVGDVSGSRLFRVDPSNGNRTVFTDGTCPPVYNVDRDSSGNFIVLSNGSSVYRVNASTGVTTVLSSNSVGSGINITNPRAVAVSAAGNLYVYDPYIRAVIRIDPTTGNRTTVSSLELGVGIGDDLITTTFSDFTMHMVVKENPNPAAVSDWALYE
jgi:hypothetical protein